MGRLLNPGLGEMADRLTILELKCVRAPLNSDPSHFHQELAQVQMRVDTFLREHPEVPEARTRAKMAELRQINDQLWQLEDKMAEYARPTYVIVDVRKAQTIAEIGMTIWRANQLRNVTIGEINELAGTVRGPEKL
jgi:hypothetical protein